MPNDHWAIPFSAAYVMKTIQNFDPNECSMQVLMTMILRFKFHGLPHRDHVINWIKDGDKDSERWGLGNLKLRINQGEDYLLNGGSRSSKYPNQTKSKDSVNDKDKDILQYTLRCMEKFFTGYG